MMRMNDPVTRRDVMAADAAGAMLAAPRVEAQARDDDLTKVTSGGAGRRLAAGQLSPVGLRDPHRRASKYNSAAIGDYGPQWKMHGH